MDTILVTPTGQWVWLDEVRPEHISGKWYQVKVGTGWDDAQVTAFVNDYVSQFIAEDEI